MSKLFYYLFHHLDEKNYSSDKERKRYKFAITLLLNTTKYTTTVAQFGNIEILPIHSTISKPIHSLETNHFAKYTRFDARAQYLKNLKICYEIFG